MSERVEAMQAALVHLNAAIDNLWNHPDLRHVRSDIPESIKINISKGQLMARAAMADAPRRNAMRETLEWIERHYANQDMSHVDFRVEAYTRAREALEQSQ
mgnify:CR=1 FL=1|jgi:hypothetical protein